MPEDGDGSELGFHKARFGGFSFNVENARSKEFTGWPPPLLEVEIRMEDYAFINCRYLAAVVSFL